MMNNSQMEDEDFPPLPPPLSPGQGGQDHGNLFTDGDEGEVSKLADVPAAKRRGVKRPQPKLDSQRLTSERGLPALRTLFENVPFKGKGHEAEDLQLLMQKMENWAHRLYPKLQFEDFISKVEKLGGKKDVQTCLKRIRLDMPLTHDDFMVTEGDEEAEPEAFREPDPFSDLQGPVHSTPAPPAPPVPPPPHHSPAAPSLTEEQRLRMELNRQRALERRLARQRQETDSQTVLTSSIQNESSSSTDVLNVSGDQEGTVETNGGSSCTQPLSQRPPTDPEPLSEPTEHAQTASDPEPTEHAQTASDPEPTEHAQTASDPEPTEHAQTASKPTEDIQNVHNSEPTEHAQTDLEPTEHAQTDLEPTEHAQTDLEPTEHAQTDLEPTEHAQTIIEDGD